MGGGLLQLVAYGAQDLYLTGSPDITYWKAVWKRYSNFAVESIEQVFNGSVRKGSRVSCTISRNGDMVNQCWLEITCKQTGPTWYPAEALVKEIEFELGGQKVDRHYSDFFRVYSELFHTSEQKEAYKRLTNFNLVTETKTAAASQVTRKLYLPLNFFFNKEAANALPLISLQFHECKLHFTFADDPSQFGIDGDTFGVKLYADFVYLDVEERKRYATGSHELLVEQLQFTGDEALTPSIRLNFNHPVKYLAWVIRPSAPKWHGLYNLAAPTGLHTSSLKGDNDDNIERMEDLYNDVFAPVQKAKIMLNGHDRASERSGSYYSQVIPMQCCGTKPQAGVYMYSFAIRPRDTQPSGTCNFSRIDNASLYLTMKTALNPNVVNADLVPNSDSNFANATNADLSTRVVKIFAQSYNVLRILSGMGGLAFSS
jgi:hypothetical protein